MSRNNNNNQEGSRIPENDPSKPMDSKREVENSNDEKTDQDFPGYPHYPASEDIMNQGNGYIKEDLDVENLPNSRNATGVSQRFLAGQNRGESKELRMPQADDTEDLNIRTGTGGDVNNDDLLALNADNDEIGLPQNVSNEDLNNEEDLPGMDLPEEEDQ